MKYDQIKEEENSFWDDIIQTERKCSKSKHRQNNLLPKNETVLSEAQRKLSHYSIKTRNLYNDLINKYSNDIPSYHQQKIESISKHRCELLYNHSKIKKEYLLQCFKDKADKIKQNELNGCTFSPQIHTKTRNKRLNSSADIPPKQQHQLDANIYERSVNWDKLRQENVIKAKRKYSDDLQYTYSPQIHQITQEYLTQVFNKDNDIAKQPQNYLFLLRQFKARKDQNREENRNSNNYLYSSISNKRHKISTECMTQFKSMMHQEIMNL